MTDRVAARILDAAITSLRTEIVPQLRDDATRIRFDQITRLLKAVSARLSLREEGVKMLLQSASSQAGLAIPSLADPSFEDLERERCSVEQMISDRIPALLDAAANGEEGIRALERIINMEKNFFISQDADVAAGSQIVYRGGRIDSEVPTARAAQSLPIDATTLTAYLRRRLSRSDVQAVEVRAIPGGFSKETVMFTLLDGADGTRKDLVIRKDMSVLLMGKTVADEFEPLQRLHALHFPVAKPLWLEADRGVFGSCFIVSERVSGTSNAAEWMADPTRARQACRELAQVLAKLHAFAPQQLGYPQALAALSAGESMEKEIALWTRLFHARKSEASPLQELPLVWLARNIPRQLYERPGRVVHGDCGFHNMMFDEQGHVTALLDWEFSILGDPTQDLCFVRLFVERIMPWREFLDLYLSLGGVAPCEEAEFFFDLWSKTRNSIGCVDARAIFDTAMPDEVKFALAGYVFAPYLNIDGCESLLAHLRTRQSA